MQKTLLKVAAIALAAISIVMFIIGLSIQDIGFLSISAFCAWFSALFSETGKPDRNIIYIFFLFTFFIFLLSRIMVRWLQFGEIYEPFSKDVMVMVYSCIVISLFGLMVGSYDKRKFALGKRVLGPEEYSEQPGFKGNIALIRQLSGIFAVVCGFAYMLTIIERIAFWRITGYGGDLRTSFTTTLPSLVVRASYVYILMFCIYLATMPAKRRCVLILFQYVLCSALKMFYGSRGDFILGLMFILVYFAIRDRLNIKYELGETKWVGRSEKTFAIVSIPVLIVLVVFVGYYRTHRFFEFSGLLDTFLDFFESQGTSVNVIGYTDIYKNQFTQPKFLYLFDRTYEFLTTNPIASFITGRHSYAANTVERAKYGTSLGMTLYYNINSYSYLAGNGSGTSYVAEAWLGYGYLGLFIVNIFLSRVMIWLNNYSYSRLIPSTIALVYLQSLFFMPRGGFDAFVGDMVSVTHIFAVFVLWVLYKAIKNRYGNRYAGNS